MKFKLHLSLIALVSLLSLPALADVGMISMGITNSIEKNATTTRAIMGNSGVKVDNQDNCGFVFRFKGDTTGGSGAVTITFERSADNSNWETTPTFTWATAHNSLTEVVAVTNFPQLIIGAFGYVRVKQIQNADANSTCTNASLYLVKKTIKPAP